VAQECSIAGGEERSAHATALAHGSVTDRIHAAQQRDEQPGGDESIDDIAPESARDQLRSPDDPVLSRGELGQDPLCADNVEMLVAQLRRSTLTAHIAVNVETRVCGGRRSTLSPARSISAHVGS
jgi:hypothetical protein